MNHEITVLIIGGAGILGVPLCNMLAESDCFNVISLDISTSIDLVKSVRQVKADRSNIEVLERLNKETENEDIVIIDIIPFSVDEILKVNICFNKIFQYILISTTLVYGRINFEEITINEDFNISDIGRLGGYVDQKLKIESYIKNRKELNWTILRPYHVIGNRTLIGCLPFHNRDKELLNTIKHNGKITLCNKGKVKLSFIDPDDFSKLVVALVGNEDAMKNVFNICHPEVVLADKYYQLIAELLNCDIHIEECSRSSIWKSHYGWEMTTFPHIYDSSKIYDVSGFTPNTTLKTSLKKSISFIESGAVIRSRVADRMNKKPRPLFLRK